MGRYGGIDTDGFTRSLLGGAAIGQRTISLAQDQQALLERLRQQQLREQTDQNTARYLQTIFSGGQMPQGFDAGTVDPQAIQTGAQWGDEIANRQAENDFYNGIFTGQPMQANPRVSPQSLRFGMEYRQDQADSRGMADQYAMARGEGPGMVGPQSPDVQSAYGMSAQALAPMVRETLEQRAKRESAELQKQALAEALRALDAAALTPGRFTPSQYEGARRQLIDRMNGLEDMPQSLYAGPPQQGQQSMTPEELAQSIMFQHPGTPPDQALRMAQASINFSKLDGEAANMLMDPGRQARQYHEKRLKLAMDTAELKETSARHRISAIAEWARNDGSPEYVEAMNDLKAAQDERLKAAGAMSQYLDQQMQMGQTVQPAMPQGAPQPDATNDEAAMDAVMSANPQLPNEPDELYAKRLAALLRGAPR